MHRRVGARHGSAGQPKFRHPTPACMRQVRRGYALGPDRAGLRYRPRVVRSLEFRVFLRKRAHGHQELRGSVMIAAGAAVELQPAHAGKLCVGAPETAEDRQRKLGALEFRLHLWDEAREQVEQLLAATWNGSIGYAVLHEAAREYPARYITLSRNGRIVFQWNGQARS